MRLNLARSSAAISAEERIADSGGADSGGEACCPASWRNNNIECTKEEALETIKEYRRKIVDRETTFVEIANQVSNCSSTKHDGALGCFKRGQMQHPFEEAAFALRVGQLSQVIDTNSGYHIILRTA